MNVPLGIVAGAPVLELPARAASVERAAHRGRRLDSGSRCWSSASARCRPCSSAATASTGSRATSSSRSPLIAAVSLGAFVWHELRVAHPVVDLRVFRHRALAVGCVYGALVGVGLYGSVFLFPLFTQQVLHWSSWQSGLGIAPSSLATAHHDADRRPAGLARRAGAALRDRRRALRPDAAAR